jgi:uncharacterized DUF497 family protein
VSDDIRFEWDAAKADSNIRKHGISFELAVRVFADPLHVTDQDWIEGGEYRWRAVGIVEGVRMIVVAYTWRDDEDVEVVRIISARPAERAERRRYEQ